MYLSGNLRFLPEVNCNQNLKTKWSHMEIMNENC